MKAAILYFSKLFLILTVAYGGFQFLTLYFFGGNQQLHYPLLSGLGLGLILAFVFTFSQIAAVKKLHPGKLTSEALSMHQVTHMQVPLTKAQILEKLQSNYPTKDWELTEESDLIKLKTSFTAKTFGEKITIKVNKLQNGLSEVFVESKPKTWFTLVDYGKNLKNIIYLRNLLSA
ncbi:hypothetical protein [Adhaeribacter terreus]|uniref:DUF1499 domain-containing protein n=1 Tax=Adhaeribacter terreus TaxID=529703 RepID=A0ABW0E4C3_9BACT